MERRFKGAFLSYDAVLYVLRGQTKVVFNTTPSIPEDCFVSWVGLDSSRHGFRIILHSNEWDIVPQGEVIPTIDVVVEFESLRADWPEVQS